MCERRSLSAHVARLELLHPALDDKNGARVWEYRFGRGSGIGGVWGAAVDNEQAYFAVADQRTPSPGGLHAVRLNDGQRAWFTPPRPPLCGSGNGCSSAQSAAVTVIPGVVFSGSVDGHLRGFSTTNGAIVWDFDTVRTYETINGVSARGGSMNVGGPAISGGTIFVNSGYVQNGIPGNVLLAFSVDGK